MAEHAESVGVALRETAIAIGGFVWWLAVLAGGLYGLVRVVKWAWS